MFFEKERCHFLRFVCLNAIIYTFTFQSLKLRHLILSLYSPTAYLFRRNRESRRKGQNEMDLLNCKIMKYIPTISFVALAFILMASTCRPFSTKDISKMKPLVELKKGPCFGSCPVFEMIIYEGGWVSYEGERFTNRIGMHMKQIDVETFKDVMRAFEDADVWQYQNIYKAQIPDMATVTVVYHKDGNTKSIKGKDGRPAKIVELGKMLDQIAQSSGWERYSGTADQDVPKGSISNEIIVNLARDVDPAVWIIQFSRQEMNIVKRISPSSPYWLVRFNTNAMDPNEMLERVRRDPYVLSAEFNKEVNANPRR